MRILALTSLLFSLNAHAAADETVCMRELSAEGEVSTFVCKTDRLFEMYIDVKNNGTLNAYCAGEVSDDRVKLKYTVLKGVDNINIKSQDPSSRYIDKDSHEAKLLQREFDYVRQVPLNKPKDNRRKVAQTI